MLDKEIFLPLVIAAQANDADAFSQLYAHYYKSLYKTAYYLIGNAQDAEDVVMDTVGDAYQSIGKLRAAEAFEGWIYKILYNKARRRRGVLVYRATSELPDELAADSRTADQIGENVDLLRALNTLTTVDRSIVVLAVCAGYTSAEIGNILSMNANTVRSKQMRALARLRTQLEE